MTTHTLTHEVRPRNSLLDYFKRRRAFQIAKYVDGDPNPYLRRYVRNNARSWALHYGRLIRKLEGQD